MSGPKQVLDALILGRIVVAVDDCHGDGCTRRFALENAREDFDLVLLVAGRRDVALAGSPPGELGLNLLCGELDAGLDAVQNGADGRTVALAERGDADDIAIRIGRPATDGHLLRDVVHCDFRDLFGRLVRRIDYDVGKRPEQLLAVGGVFTELPLRIRAAKPRRKPTFPDTAPQGCRVGGQVDQDGVFAKGPSAGRVQEARSAADDQLPVRFGKLDRHLLLDGPERLLAMLDEDLAAGVLLARVPLEALLDEPVRFNGFQAGPLRQLRGDGALPGPFRSCQHDLHGQPSASISAPRPRIRLT